jgi:hypothetical protein
MLSLGKEKSLPVRRSEDLKWPAEGTKFWLPLIWFKSAQCVPAHADVGFGKFQNDGEISRSGILTRMPAKGNVLEPGWTHTETNKRWMVKFWRSYLIIVILLADNAPVLISWTDATTLFHEFGHASWTVLQMLLNSSWYVAGLCGISFKFWSVAWNLKFALHYKTNEPIPMALWSVSTKHLL